MHRFLAFVSVDKIAMRVADFRGSPCAGTRACVSIFRLRHENLESVQYPLGGTRPAFALAGFLSKNRQLFHGENPSPTLRASATALRERGLRSNRLYERSRSETHWRCLFSPQNSVAIVKSAAIMRYYYDAVQWYQKYAHISAMELQYGEYCRNCV